ncbi:hypothetical protein Csac_2763 [Caldicellulosiruptor saccharolyticus DSM 8903]|uniref:DUF4446 domain-containing protein n=1 Tax=Caldicellulosiruptor saccharolyticus (strain ATCC 43494 / DSM 8903 / Tp8T 6331) TaxID=351627 RepID=A4XN43_CALS8|nr:DUF4446 family protein [Caldicellulosiruptor saccharolyticus]ABP68328.1 hypothetical protein Csac_2763 [Caldicellulosiruptor saccharolyticus DSM 8903]
MKDFLSSYSNQIIIALLSINMILFIALLIQSVKNKNLKRRFLALVKNDDFKTIEEILRETNEKIEYFEEVLKALHKSYRVLSENSKLNIKKLGVVRYDAFENVGSKLSFAIALLDEYDNGVVLNSIYSRDGSSIYAKPIENGLSKYPLSAEEMQAIDLARKNYLAKEIKE